MPSMKASLAAGVLAAALGGQAVAQGTNTYTTTFQVRIGIQGSCILVSASDIDFGTKVPNAGTHDEVGTINVQCTKDTPFTLGLDGGTSTGNITARAMTSAGAPGVNISYLLTKDAARTQIWGDTTTTWVSGVGLGLGAAYTIPYTTYARATLVGNEPPGTYSDTVTAILTY